MTDTWSMLYWEAGKHFWVWYAGGVVERDIGPSRLVPKEAFLGAPYFARGGVIGVDEVPAILHKGEVALRRQAWDVLTRSSGQLRIAPGAVIGIDIGVALSLGEALGYDLQALAELLPAGEAGMVKALNGQTGDAQ